MESLCKGKKTKKIRKGCHITSLWKSKLNSQSQRTKKKDNTNRRKEIMEQGNIIQPTSTNPIQCF